MIFDLFDKNFSWHDILIEFHGLVFDLFVFGIILTIVEQRRNKKEKENAEVNKRNELISRYKEEINDYKFWVSAEAMFRTRGLIRRLVDLGATELDLSYCYLATDKSFSTYSNMKKWNFSGANLEDSFFLGSDMTETKFYHTNLQEATFNRVNLTGAVFSSANLYRTNFEECDFTNVSLYRVTVNEINWFENLLNSKNIGIKKLMEIYKVDDKPFNIENKSYFNIIRR